MTWLTVSALIAAPFAGVLVWGLMLRHVDVDAGVRTQFRTVWDLTPLLGWAFRLHERGAAGREAAIRAAIEIGAVAVAGWAIVAKPDAWVWQTCLLGWLLIAASAVDARERLLPDELNLAVGALGLAVAIPLGRSEVIDRAVGVAIGFAVFAAFAFLYSRVRGRDGLGLGDAKLLAALGAWVGWQGLASVVVIGAGVALVAVIATTVARRTPLRADLVLPLGPFLALGGWLTWLYGPLGFTAI